MDVSFLAGRSKGWPIALSRLARMTDDEVTNDLGAVGFDGFSC